ncbi:hypothetical protein [Alteromonas gilva]|uniref:Lipoprotein n=1 Tax=Alteromonas gilva TaxID=2987522 RepID=A0ABT5L5Q1_9ALTE|nr:hypothetical protein [Alteromonas gilva]MDC8832364.1 hypothetical protein [Alteromonas gilva]
MTLLRNAIIISACLLVISCSNLAFNERYENIKWNSIVVFPATGAHSAELTNILEHNLISSENMVVFSPKYVEDNYSNGNAGFDISEMKSIASNLGANGILITELSVSETESYKSNIGVDSVSAVVFYRLIDADTGLTVATSSKEESSIFSDSKTVIENAALSALGDIESALDKLSD